jgi:hypothetical protein
LAAGLRLDQAPPLIPKSRFLTQQSNQANEITIIENADVKDFLKTCVPGPGGCTVIIG